MKCKFTNDGWVRPDINMHEAMNDMMAKVYSTNLSDEYFDIKFERLPELETPMNADWCAKRFNTDVHTCAYDIQYSIILSEKNIFRDVNIPKDKIPADATRLLITQYVQKKNEQMDDVLKRLGAIHILHDTSMSNPTAKLTVTMVIPYDLYEHYQSEIPYCRICDYDDDDDYICNK